MPINDNFAIAPTHTPTLINSATLPALSRKEMSIQDLTGILSRRREIFIGAMIICLGAGALKFATTTRLYMGSAQIQVQKESADALSMNTVMGPQNLPDAVDSNITIQTQAGILRSDSLALQVIKELNLEHTPDFQPHFSLIGWVKGWFTPAGRPDPPNVALEDAPGRRTGAINTFE